MHQKISYGLKIIEKPSVLSQSNYIVSISDIKKMINEATKSPPSHLKVWTKNLGGQMVDKWFNL